MQKGKRITAILLAAVLFVSAVSFQPVFAADRQTAETVGAAVQESDEAQEQRGDSAAEDTYVSSYAAGAAAVYNGVDYSAVYDYEYYITKYADVRNAYGGDDEAVLKHFVVFGMKEARQAISSFNVTSYRYAYQDLRLAFGSDLKSYYIHYINYGKREGRTATGTTSLQNPVTSYGGVDYSSVYDYNYYISKYPDVRQAYGDDDVLVLQHFIAFGMKESRQASSAFNVAIYKNNYYDLQKAFGSDLKSYFLHYIKYGRNENRNAVTAIYTAIMNSPTTTVSQMAAYYNANASYPSYYSGSDAATITAFCQMYYDESTAEGVDPAVAFCQAMKETGFLRFGGSVPITAYNFGGLGATDSNTAGYATFSSVRIGIRAQVQHLKAYASTDSLNNECVDPRFSLVTRGSAVCVEWLGQKENPNGYGWATAVNYGYSIKNDYMAVLYQY
ncbi:MAG: glucosaminidase domain-containing protein [Lachnospiraceae bacterium]|nr:glucosaminidase domain-containing protein [Lachnospiraceae bacterium]